MLDFILINYRNFKILNRLWNQLQSPSMGFRKIIFDLFPKQVMTTLKFEISQKMFVTLDCMLQFYTTINDLKVVSDYFRIMRGSSQSLKSFNTFLNFDKKNINFRKRVYKSNNRYLLHSKAFKILYHIKKSKVSIQKCKILNTHTFDKMYETITIMLLLFLLLY